MPYDPSLPLPNSPLESHVIRDQFQALFNLITNIDTITAAQIDAVNTVPAGAPAAVTVSVTAGMLHFRFDIPQGIEGPEGPAGVEGPEGPQGVPGEVTALEFVEAIAGTSSNSNAVDTLGMGVSDPPTQSEVQAIADKVDELINALRR